MLFFQVGVPLVNMTNYEFNALSFSDQAQAVWDFGTYQSCRGLKGHKVNFYSLFDFYVEVYWNRTTNEIDKIVSFKTGAKLDRYLSKIDINQVV